MRGRLTASELKAGHSTPERNGMLAQLTWDKGSYLVESYGPEGQVHENRFKALPEAHRYLYSTCHKWRRGGSIFNQALLAWGRVESMPASWVCALYRNFSWRRTDATLQEMWNSRMDATIRIQMYVALLSPAYYDTANPELCEKDRGDFADAVKKFFPKDLITPYDTATYKDFGWTLMYTLCVGRADRQKNLKAMARWCRKQKIVW